MSLEGKIPPLTPHIPIRPAGYFQKDEQPTPLEMIARLEASAGGGIPDEFIIDGPIVADRIVSYSLAEGRKDDGDKCRMELIPPEFLFATATILTFGASKYADRNWELGMSWGRVFGALMRHLWAWWGGKGPTTRSFLFGSTDDETQRSHLWHACCCLAFLVAYEERGVGTDDRLAVTK